MDNVILIGMPSSGKTTAGRRAAELLGLPFLDSDALIAKEGGASLPELIERLGAEGFLSLEEGVNAGVRLGGCIFATGGSAVYSERAMAHLKSLGPAVYLKISLETVKRRIPDFASRGVVMRGDLTTLDELFFERTPLYEKYADLTIECDGLTAEETAQRIAAAFRKEKI